jgi:hypothetical protein
MFVVVPVGLVLIAAGSGLIGWYAFLSPEDKREADRLMGEIAWGLSRRSISELDADQLKQVSDETERRLSRRDH